MFNAKRITGYKNPGGGPAPLLYNPQPITLRNTAYLHLVLSLLCAVGLTFPLLIEFNKGCTTKTSEETGFLCLLQFLSLIVFIYFMYMSHKKMGTEVEWARVILLSSILVASEGGVTFWGMLIMSQKINKALSDSPSCEVRRTLFWFICTVVSVTTVCMISTVYFFWRMTTKILEQLASLGNFI